jgi:hypothetical protein
VPHVSLIISAPSRWCSISATHVLGRGIFPPWPLPRLSLPLCWPPFLLMLRGLRSWIGRPCVSSLRSPILLFRPLPVFAVASASACYFLDSLGNCFYRSACNSCSVEGRSLCLASWSVSNRDYFPLSCSRRFSRCSISGVKGIGSLPLMSLDPDVFEKPR